MNWHNDVILLSTPVVQTTVGVFVSSSLDYWTLLQHARMRELCQAAWSYPNLNCLWHIRRLALAWLAGPRPMLVTKSLVWIQQPAMLRIFRAWLGGRDLVLKCFVWIFFSDHLCTDFELQCGVRGGGGCMRTIRPHTEPSPR